MPELHNPTGNRLFCHQLQRILEAGETVEISDEDAAELEAGSIFAVSRPKSAQPVREETKRGGKRAEVTKAPDAETRG